MLMRSRRKEICIGLCGPSRQALRRRLLRGRIASTLDATWREMQASLQSSQTPRAEPGEGLRIYS